ncbi:hypothetical protein Ssi03_07860 [Sphaerisporangium siamense]|nr:hypothetical protein Skr01_15290 [Sphaerisporangium krabiense]GII82796.1 hypothetical protein Ssi03_07860 [Sphaerisporangium siamense]
MVEGGPVLVNVDLGDIIEMDHRRITACQSRGWDGRGSGRVSHIALLADRGAPVFTIDRRSGWPRLSLGVTLAWNVHNGNKTIPHSLTAW